jgi:hypothetical protein
MYIYAVAQINCIHAGTVEVTWQPTSSDQGFHAIHSQPRANLCSQLERLQLEPTMEPTECVGIDTNGYEVWHVLAAGIFSYAKSSRPSESDAHPCMSNKAEKFCSSEKCGESFFRSSVDMFRVFEMYRVFGRSWLVLSAATVKIGSFMCGGCGVCRPTSHCKSGSALRVFLFQHKMLFESIPHFKKKRKS